MDDAKVLVASQLTLPAGYRLQWTGQYEFLAEREGRLRYVIPLTLVLVVVLLYLAMRGWPQTFCCWPVYPLPSLAVYGCWRSTPSPRWREPPPPSS